MELRQALFDGITPEDVQAIAAGLVAKAKAGDQGAIKILFTHVLGGSSINIRQGVVYQEAQQAPPAAIPIKPAVNGHGKRFEILEDRTHTGDWLVMGIKPGGERVLLAGEKNRTAANLKRDMFKEQLEDYEDIFVEKIGSQTPTANGKHVPADEDDED